MPVLLRPHVSVFLGSILLIAGAIIFLWSLGTQALIDYDEAAYAMVLEDTREAGQFASLTTAGRNWFDKPPLYFWLAEGFASLGFPVEWYMRLPAALAGLASVLLVYLIVFQITRRPFVAFFSGAILGTTAAFVEASREARMDAPIAACTLAAFFALLRVAEDRRWWLLFGASVGIGIMIKSAVGILPLFVLAAWVLVERDFGFLKDRYFWFGSALAAVFALPWHLYQSALFGMDFWRAYLGLHVLERYSENLFGNQVTSLLYLEFTALHALPWVFLFGAIIVLMVMRPRWFQGLIGTRAAQSALAAVFIGAIFLTAETVVVHYLVPMYPFFAITIALGAYVLWERVQDRIPIWVPVSIAALAVLVGGAVTVMAGLHVSEDLSYEQRLAEDERVIGEEIGKAPTLPVYFDRPVYWETVHYYSGRRDAFAVLPESEVPAPYFLVATPQSHANDPRIQDLFAHHEVVHEGTYASLLMVR